MFIHQQVILVEEQDFRLLVVLIAAFLIVSLLINGLLTMAPASVTGPPVKVYGYFGADGMPVDGYYSNMPEILITPPQSPQVASLVTAVPK
jgi:hypothetical protein